MHYNQRGFHVVAVLLCIAVIGFVGFVGLKVYIQGQESKTQSVATQNEIPSKEQVSKKGTPDPTANWSSYSKANGYYSFKYPGSWVKVDNEYCGEGLTLLGSNKDVVGKCGAGNTNNQMFINSYQGDGRLESSFNSKNSDFYATYTQKEQKDVTVDGVMGTRESSVIIGQEAMGGAGTLPDNTRLVMYIFYTNGRTYVASYKGRPTHPDTLKEFDLMVTKTLKFSVQ